MTTHHDIEMQGGTLQLSGCATMPLKVLSESYLYTYMYLYMYICSCVPICIDAYMIDAIFVIYVEVSERCCGGPHLVQSLQLASHLH